LRYGELTFARGVDGMAGKQTTELGTREEARSATQRDEVVLVVRAAGGDAEAFEALYRCFYPRLRRFLERMTRRPQLVEEILNDTMLVVWRKAHTYNFRSKVSTWIFAIAFRKALKAVKRVDDPVAYEPEEGANPTRSGPEDELMAHQLHLLLSRAMTSLSAEQRAVIELTYYQGCAYREIAEIMGCPIDTVKTRMFHARRRLKVLLSGRREDML
jgi:RNA polymerase sigma factor (sigma-70 family)